MTRREFLESVNDFYDLITFCNDNGCDICEDLYDDDEYDEAIENDIRDTVGDYSWRDFRDYLSDLPTGYDWYRRDGEFDYVGVDHDFDEYKADVLRWADDEGDIWDEDDEEEEEDDEEYDDEDLVFEESDISMEDMMKAGFSQVSAFLAQNAEENKRQAEAFEELLVPKF